MPDSDSNTPWRDRLHQLDGLLREIEHFKDPAARTQARVIVQNLMEVHGAALEKILGKIAATGEQGLAMIDSLAEDDLISSLLLLYGLHPLDLETRVRQALDHAGPVLKAHGGHVDLLEIAGGVVRLRLGGSCEGCPSSAVTLKQTIEEAIYDRAPEVTAIEVEGLAPPVAEHRGIALPLLAH